jgi:hypothetical protein
MLDIIFKKANGLPHIPTTYNVKFCLRCVAPSEDRGAQSAGARTEMSQKRMRAEKGCHLSACVHDARLWGKIPVHCDKRPRKKNPDGFLSILL